MAERSAPRLTVSDLMAEASDFSRDGWRACWLAILLVTLGHTLQFLNGFASSSAWRPGVFGLLAYGLMIVYVPLYGGLYRVAIGGKPAAGRRFGGLQWNGVEWRMLAVGVVIAFLIGLSVVPILAVMGVMAVVFGSHAQIGLGPLGHVSAWGLASVPIWLLFIGAMAPRIGRLTLGWAYSTAHESIEPFAGWEPARRSGWTIALALGLAIAPLLFGFLSVYVLTWVENDALRPKTWPLPEAIGAGVLLGGLAAAVIAPLLVGVITAAFRRLETPDRSAAGVWAADAPPLVSENPAPADSNGPGEDASPSTPFAAEGVTTRHEAEAACVDAGSDLPPSRLEDVPEHAGPGVEPELKPVQRTESTPRIAASARGDPPEAGDPAPLSLWPHSVLPRGPARPVASETALASAALVKAGPAESESVSPRLASAPLAQGDEPAHRFVEITELK